MKVPNIPSGRGRDLPAEMKQAENFTFDTWHVCFVQDCNMRCAYCATAYGTFGGPKGSMPSKTWKRLVEFALDHTGGEKHLCFICSGGETFLVLPAFLKFVDYTWAQASKRNITVTFTCITNGTLPDQNDLESLADRRVGISFSIDGPKPIHDRHRRTADGKGSFDAALWNYRKYRKLSWARRERPACNVQSVFTGGVRLPNLIRFWSREGQPTFSCAIQSPSRFYPYFTAQDQREIQKRYLTDLRNFAQTTARELTPLDFLSKYRGPGDLYDLWKSLFLGLEPGICGAGRSAIAVDVRGNLYPCEGYIGFEKHRIGTLQQGIDHGRITAFRNQIERFLSRCRMCTSHTRCPKNCIASNPVEPMAQSYFSGCWFAKRILSIAAESYDILMDSRSG